MGKQGFLNNSDFSKLQIGFQKYDSLFLGNVVTYYYMKDGQKHYVSVAFRKQNFRHLSGCCLKNRSANSFYNSLKKKRIKRTDIYYQSDYAKAKLQILPSLELLLTDKVQVTEGNGSVNLQFDNMIKSNKQILGLACITNKGGKYSKPVSLLNMKLNSPIKNAKLIKYPVTDIDIKPIDNNIKK